jgi:small-conductance mechanosensitive channel
MSQPIAPAVSPAQLTSNGALADIFTTLDAIGVDIGNTRLSLWSALVVFVVLLAIFLFARLGSKLAKKVFARLTRLDPAQQLLGEKLVSVGVWALAILIGIDVLGVDLTALAVFSGAFGLAIGFGLQRTFGNLIAGIILLMDKSIKPGDVIAVSDTSGRESVGQIRKIGIRAISVITRDRKEYLIPNENLMVNQVENWSYSSRDVRVRAPVGVSYDTDLAVAESLMLQAAKGVNRVLENPEPKALLMAFGDSAVQFEIRFWISDPEEGLSNVRSDVLKQVWRLFRENGINIPFPQRDLHIKDWPKPPEPAG